MEILEENTNISSLQYFVLYFPHILYYCFIIAILFEIIDLIFLDQNAAKPPNAKI